MASVYVDATGLHVATVEEVLDDVVSSQRANIAPDFDTDADGIVGNLNAIVVSHIREVLELVQVAYNAFDPDNADERSLAALGLLTGMQWREAEKGQLKGTRRALVTIPSNGLTLPAGNVFYPTGDPTNRWVTTRPVTATSGAGEYGVTAEAETAGPIPLAAGTHVIATPHAAWTSVRTTKDAIIGRPRETPEEFRKRRVLELPGLGSSTADAIRAAVLSIENEDGERPIRSCIVLDNDTDFVSVDGLPPHSFCVIIWDGPSPDSSTDDLVAQTIFDEAPAGIEAYGTTVGEALNYKGEPKPIRFSRVAQLPLTINVDLTTYNAYPGNSYAEEQVSLFSQQEQFPGGEAQWDAYAAVLRGLPGVKVESIQFNALPPFTDAPATWFQIYVFAGLNVI